MKLQSLKYDNTSIIVMTKMVPFTYSTALAHPNATHSALGKGLASKDLLRNKFTPGAV